MIARKIIGACLLASPFVAIAVWFGAVEGWRAAVAIFGGVTLLVIVMLAGAVLLSWDERTR